MQTVKPRARYLHPGQVVVWDGKSSYEQMRGWLFYDVTLTGALKRYFDHVLRNGHAQLRVGVVQY